MTYTWISELNLLHFAVADALMQKLPANWLRIPYEDRLLTPQSYKRLDSGKVRFMIEKEPGQAPSGHNLDPEDYIFCNKSPRYLDASFAYDRVLECSFFADYGEEINKQMLDLIEKLDKILFEESDG